MNLHHLTEADLYRMGTPAGWAENRPHRRANGFQHLLKRLIDLVPANKHALAQMWLKEIYDRFVNDLRTLSRVRTRNALERSGRRIQASKQTTCKASTVVNHELKSLREAIHRTLALLNDISPTAQELILAYVRQYGGPAQVTLEPQISFHEFWGATFNVVFPYLAACERFDEFGLKLPKSERTRLAQFVEVSDQMIYLVEDLSDVTQEALELGFEEMNRLPDLFIGQEIGSKDLRSVVIEGLSYIAVVLDHLDVKTKRGQEDVAAKSMVGGLAELMCTCTGEEPRRVTEQDQEQRWRPRKEAGTLLKLAQALSNCARDHLSDESIRVNTQLTKIVRQVLDERKALAGRVA